MLRAEVESLKQKNAKRGLELGPRELDVSSYTVTPHLGESAYG